MALADNLPLSADFRARIGTYQLYSYRCQFRIAGCGFGIGDWGIENRGPRMVPDLGILDFGSFILKLFVRQTEIRRRELQYCLGSCQKQTVIAAPREKLYRVLRLASVHFKA